MIFVFAKTPGDALASLVKELENVVAANAEKKLAAVDALVSQFYEGGANGSANLMPSEPAKQKARHQQVRDGFARRNQSIADRFRVQLSEWYSQAQGETVRYAEAFELCEYGSQPNKSELKHLFPFFGD